MKFALSTILLVSFSYSTPTFAHGEDKPGPHGGEIRMPGAFHTEVVTVGSNKVRVYLLDMNFKNPSVKDSSVSAELTLKSKKSFKAACQQEKDSFLCAFDDKSADLKSPGELKIHATREKLKGNEAKYSLPSGFKDRKGHQHGHGNHHE